MSKSNKKLIYLIAAVIVAAATFVNSEILPKFKRAKVGTENVAITQLSDDSHIFVHYIDVGQGDSTLIETNSGKFVLIDTGSGKNEHELLTYLDSRNVEYIEYLVITHPHEDHMGNADSVLNGYYVKNVIKNDKVGNDFDTVRFEEALEESQKHLNTKVIVAQTGDEFYVDGIEFVILSDGKDYDDLNDSSLCIRMEYGKSTFIFTGDAGKRVERDIISGDYDISAEVLKCGHHGSSTSNSEDFLGQVNPDIAIISCELNNSYGHPHVEVLESLEDRNVTIYRTDKDESVVLRCSKDEINYVKFE